MSYLARRDPDPLRTELTAELRSTLSRTPEKGAAVKRVVVRPSLVVLATCRCKRSDGHDRGERNGKGERDALQKAPQVSQAMTTPTPPRLPGNNGPR